MIYNKPLFSSVERVARYVGRYTHRVAISNERPIAIEGGQIRFRYRDNNDGGKQKVMTLSALDFAV
jgi:hypothetical protein